MNTWIALLRGINIVGKKVVPMKELKALLDRHGCVDVRTYIQSGNVVFRSALTDANRVEARLAGLVAKRYGFMPRVLVLTRRELERAAAGNPFPQAAEAPKSVHLFFLAETPAGADLKTLEAVRVASERYALKGRTFYLHTPDGFGTSKLAGRVERLLGVDATARNWRTVTTVLEIAKTYP